MVYSYELEQQFLGGLLNHPEKYMEIASFITSKDFVSDVNGVVFTFLKLDYEEGNYIDEVVLAEKIKLSGISFEDNINISEYSRALKLRKGSAESIIDSAKELSKLTVRRGIGETGAKLTSSMKNLDSSKNFTQIIDLADSIYNDQVSSYELGDNKASNIFEEICTV